MHHWSGPLVSTKVETGALGPGAGSGVFREEVGRGAWAPSAWVTAALRALGPPAPHRDVGTIRHRLTCAGPWGGRGAEGQARGRNLGGWEEAAGTRFSPPRPPPPRARPPPSPCPQLQPSAPRARAALRRPVPPQAGAPRRLRLPYLSIPGAAVKEQGHPPHRADPAGS